MLISSTKVDRKREWVEVEPKVLAATTIPDSPPVPLAKKPSGQTGLILNDLNFFTQVPDAQWCPDPRKNGQMSTERQEMRSHLSNNTQQSYPIFFQHPRQTICVRSDHHATLLLIDTSTCSMTWTAWDGLDIDHIKTFPEENNKICCDFFCSLLVAVSISIQKTWQDPHTAWEPWRGGWGHKEGKLLAEYQLGTPVEGQATWPSCFKSSVGSSSWINGY